MLGWSIILAYFIVLFVLKEPDNDLTSFSSTSHNCSRCSHRALCFCTSKQCYLQGGIAHCLRGCSAYRICSA